jgi:Zn-finger nucleic acid-binding protein
MEGVAVGASNLLECPKCEGIWADAESLEKICADREEQAAVLGMAVSLPDESGNLETVRYIPCPVCNKLMNRVNFANCSHVIVDVCKAHGTWFDKDELRRIVEFIRAGGLEQARARQISELQEQERQLKAARMSGAWEAPEPRRNDYREVELGISAAADFLKHWLR